MLIPFGIFAQQSRERVWEVNVHAHPNTMTWVLQITYEDVLDPTLEIGAFCGDECRGIIAAQYEPLLNDYRWYLNIQGEGGEPLSFYVRRNGIELDAVTDFTYNFVVNGKLGTIPDPYVIDFQPTASSYYILITDESQLVSGRKYLIANGKESNVKAIGFFDDGQRGASDLTIGNRKVHTIPAYNNADENAFEFTLGGSVDAWTFYDEINRGYLTAGRRSALDVENAVTDAGRWQVNITPTGALGIYNGNKNCYIIYDEEGGDPAFYCGDEYTLYLLAKCEIVSGTMESLPIADPTKMFVVEAGQTLTVDNLSTVNMSNLILEDGAQLINASENVQATMQKAVTGYDDVEASNGWYTVASPMAASAVEVGSNLVFPNYDLYAFDETNLTNEEWRNYKNNAGGFTSFEAGRGYLYANSNTFTPVFKGTLNHADVVFPLTYTNDRTDELIGFNLVGNPFPHNIYKGAGSAIDDARLAAGYYVLTNGGEWEAKTYQDAILPGQGILVQTSEAGPLTISKTVAVATAETSSREGLGHVALRITDGNAEDAAYVFGGLVGNLRKINHLNANSPMLSIVRDNERFAIAGIESGCESVDFRFDNHKAGTFNLTVDPTAWKGNYLHLIDNIAGTETDLLHTPSYTFSATGDEHPFRFRVVLAPDAASASSFAFFDGALWVVINDRIAELQVVDMMGRVLNTQTIDGSAEVSINQPTGVYMLRLVTDDDVKVQKVVVR
jgi:hypothetical protein